MANKPGILISQADTTPDLVAEFDEWYDTEHIPIRLALPGFASAERYHHHEGDGPQHLVLYHLTDIAELSSPGYDDVKRGSGDTERTRRMLRSVSGFTRYTGEQQADTHPAAGLVRASAYVLLELFDVPEDHWTEMHAWYEQDQLPHLLEAYGWDRTRRYRVFAADPAGVNLAVVHELSDLAAASSEQRRVAQSSSWTKRLSGERWFAARRTSIFSRRMDRPHAFTA